MTSLDIIPLHQLGVTSFLSTCVHFQGTQSIDKITSTVYHLVHNRHVLLREHDPKRFTDRAIHLNFTIDSPDNYLLLKNQLADLEQSFCGTFSVSSILNRDQVKIMVVKQVAPVMELYHVLRSALDPVKEKINDMTTVIANQPGPVTQWTGGFVENADDNPLFDFVAAFCTDQDAYPAIIFKLAMEGDDEAESKIGHLMVHAPVGMVVRIRLCIPKKDQPMAKIEDSTVSIWRYVPGRPQPAQVQAPEKLSEPGGRIRLWVSDFLSAQDDSIPEHLKRPYPTQAAYDMPNFSIAYSIIAQAIRATTPGMRQVVRGRAVAPKLAGVRGHTTGSRGYSTVIRPTRGLRLGAGGNLVGLCNAFAAVSHGVGMLSRRLRK